MVCRDRARVHNWKKAFIITLFISIVLFTSLRLVTKENKATENLRNDDHVIAMNRSNLCRQNACCLISSSTAQTYGYKKCCKIQCTNFDTTSFNLSRVVDTIVMRHCKEPILDLVIDNVLFLNNTMRPGWIHSGNYTLGALTLTDYNETLIVSPKSFSGNIFKDIEFFALKNVNMSRMDINFFNGLSSLQYLYIDNSTIKSIDREASLEINGTLEILQIHKSEFDFFNLTSNAVFKNLYLVDIRYNSFRSVRNHTFDGLLNCQVMHLSYNSISHIEAGVFGSLKKLQSLYLDNNLLSHLERDVFGANITEIALSLHNNPWYCRCDLDWLREYVVSKTQTDDFITPKCFQPPDVQFNRTTFCVQIDLPDMTTLNSSTCSNFTSSDETIQTDSTDYMNNTNSTTPLTSSWTYPTISTPAWNSTSPTWDSTPPTWDSTSPTWDSTPPTWDSTSPTWDSTPPTWDSTSPTQDSTSSTWHTTQPSSLPPQSSTSVGWNDTLTTKDSAESCDPNVTSVPFEVIHPNGIFVVPPEFKFNTKVMLINKQINVKFSDSPDSHEKIMELLWFESKDCFDVSDHRVSNVVDSFAISVGGDGVYFLCLHKCLNGADYTEHNLRISPFDCRSNVIPEESRRMFFTNSRKCLIISLFCVFLLTILVTGGLKVYLIMRWFPNLLKGSKSVEIVKSRKWKNSTNNNEKKNIIEFCENQSRSFEANNRKFGFRSMSDSSLPSFNHRKELKNSKYFESEETNRKLQTCDKVYDMPPKLPPRF